MNILLALGKSSRRVHTSCKRPTLQHHLPRYVRWMFENMVSAWVAGTDSVSLDDPETSHRAAQIHTVKLFIHSHLTLRRTLHRHTQQVAA